MISPIAAAVMVALAAPLPVFAPARAADRTAGPVVVVKAAAGERQGDKSGRLARRQIMADLAQRGHRVLDGAVTASPPGSIVLRVAAELRILHGTYTTRATIGLRATLEDGDTRRFLARVDFGSRTPWRLAAQCPKPCVDREVRRRIVPLAARVSADVDRRLVRLGRTHVTKAVRGTGVTVAFRRIDRALLPRIELYLRNFPGVNRIRRDHATAEGILYRLERGKGTDDTALSLRKMLHYLPLKARIVRNGNAYVVEADPAAATATGPQDW